MNPVFDSISSYTQVTSGASITGSFTNVAGEIVFAEVGEGNNASRFCIGVTYNGVALVHVNGGRVGTTGRWTSIWVWDYVANGPAPTGTHDLVATFSGSQSYPGIIGYSYSDFDTSDPIGNSNVVSTDADTNIDVSLTTTVDNSLFLLFGRDGVGGLTYTVSEGNIRMNANGGGFASADVLVPVAGAKTFTLSNATSKITVGIAVELKAPAGGASPFTRSFASVVI